MSSAPAKQNEYLTKKYVDGVYIPGGLIVFGCLIVKREWLPYAVVLALLLGGYKVFSSSKDFKGLTYSVDILLMVLSGVQKVLKPTEFQNFELMEKTIISHNVAM
jgi:cytochrome-b5 reductase